MIARAREMLCVLRYPKGTLTLLRPFLGKDAAVTSLDVQLDEYVSRHKKEDLISAAVHLLPPKNKAVFLVSIITSAGENRAVSSKDRYEFGEDIVAGIWAESKDRLTVLDEIVRLKLPTDIRGRIASWFLSFRE